MINEHFREEELNLQHQLSLLESVRCLSCSLASLDVLAVVWFLLLTACCLFVVLDWELLGL